MVSHVECNQTHTRCMYGLIYIRARTHTECKLDTQDHYYWYQYAEVEYII